MLESVSGGEKTCELNKAHGTKLCQGVFMHSYMNFSLLRKLNTFFPLP